MAMAQQPEQHLFFRSKEQPLRGAGGPPPENGHRRVLRADALAESVQVGLQRAEGIYQT